jgi:hypothetical protein
MRDPTFDTYRDYMKTIMKLTIPVSVKLIQGITEDLVCLSS